MKKTSFFIILLCITYLSACNNKKNNIIAFEPNGYEQLVDNSGNIINLKFNTDETLNILIGNTNIKLDKVDETDSVFKYMNDKYTFYENRHKRNTVLKKGDIILFNQKPEIIKGMLSYNQDASIFISCEQNKTYWINDKTKDLYTKYVKLTIDDKQGAKIYVEVLAINRGKIKTGLPSQYDGVYDIIEVNEARQALENDCK